MNPSDDIAAAYRAIHAGTRGRVLRSISLGSIAAFREAIRQSGVGIYDAPPGVHYPTTLFGVAVMVDPTLGPTEMHYEWASDGCPPAPGPEDTR